MHMYNHVSTFNNCSSLSTATKASGMTLEKYIRTVLLVLVLWVGLRVLLLRLLLQVDWCRVAALQVMRRAVAGLQVM